MANLKEVRNRIKSVINTQQITKAMKMVSAAKLRKAQQAIVEMRPYSNKLTEMLRNILSNMEGGAETSLGQERPIEKALLVVVTSDKGLCGAFNSNIIKAGLAVMNGKFAKAYANGNLTILCVGKKGSEYFNKRYGKKANIITKHTDLFTRLTFDNSAEIVEDMIAGFEHGIYDAVEVAYGQFKNAGVQYCISEQYLPVQKMEVEEEGDSKMRADFLFEPDKETLLKQLIPTILRTQFHKYLLDTNASEHGARMTAMDKASENAGDLLKELKINYNKARQEAITRELSEIVGGSAALEGS